MESSVQRYLKQRRGFASVEQELFLALQIVADRLMAPWAAHLRETVDLSPVQYNVLRILRGAGKAGLWAGEVGERLITRSPDVTRLVDRLEKRGLVRRIADPADRRAVRVHITQAGRDLIEPLDGAVHTRLHNHLSRVPPEQVVALRDQIDVLLEALADPG